MATDPERRADVDEDELASSFSDVIVPLDTAAPDAPTDDIAAIGRAIGDADVIGMGEASHGTREFFRFKHRLFQHLVADRNVRMLGLEANFAALLDVNEYVLNGDGTAEDALSRESIHRVYRTESLLELIEWCRSFNEGRPRDERIRFHGIDVQHAGAAGTRLETFFRTADPGVLETVEDALDRLTTTGLPAFSDDGAVRAHLEARTSVASTLGDALDANEAAYVEATSRDRYEVASRLVWMIERGRDQLEAIAEGRTDSGANLRIRDSAMAAQVQWLLAHEPADRIVLWGHNAHLARGWFAGGRQRQRQRIPSLGSNLAGLSDVEYYALGLTLGGGSVGAVSGGEYRAYEIDAPPEGSLPAVFGDLDPAAFFFDVEHLEPDSTAREWLDSRPRWFDITGGYRDSPVSLVESNVPTQFDGLVFFGETTAARPLEAER